MRRGTTPIIALTVQGYDLTDSTVYVTIKQSNSILTKTNEDLTIESAGGSTSITFTLSQEETLGFKLGKADIQIRWIDANGIALATDIQSIDISMILLDGVIEYE